MSDDVYVELVVERYNDEKYGVQYVRETVDGSESRSVSLSPSVAEDLIESVASSVGGGE